MEEPAMTLERRSFLGRGALSLSSLVVTGIAARAAELKKESARTQKERGKPTAFQIACMTLPYSQFPLERALAGIKAAGYRYVAWGTTHKEGGGKSVPVLAADALPDKARELAQRCRGLGLEPLMMFSGIYPENKNGLKVLKQRLLQAAAAGIPQVLTFGHTEGGNSTVWTAPFKELGGKTGTGEACAAITRAVADEGIKVSYDAGNVMDYLNLDPLPDIRKCADEVRSFCIKDHRRFPKNGDCGPGFGEIDHYRLLAPVAFTGRAMPLCCENIFAPVLPRPAKAEGVDALARRAREFLEVVTKGLQAV
jgi:sugar phosphate isomerase/epimerase